jgi:hypothetical protein
MHHVPFNEPSDPCHDNHSMCTMWPLVSHPIYATPAVRCAPCRIYTASTVRCASCGVQLVIRAVQRRPFDVHCMAFNETSDLCHNATMIVSSTPCGLQRAIISSTCGIQRAVGSVPCPSFDVFHVELSESSDLSYVVLRELSDPCHSDRLMCATWTSIRCWICSMPIVLCAPCGLQRAVRSAPRRLSNVHQVEFIQLLDLFNENHPMCTMWPSMRR